jgi:hypothetical protein
MKEITHLITMSGDEHVEAFELTPAQQLRLCVFAKANDNISVSEMIMLCIANGIAPEGQAPVFKCPDEESIVDFAATLLQALRLKRST